MRVVDICYEDMFGYFSSRVYVFLLELFRFLDF